MHEVTINIPEEAYAAAVKRAQQEGYDSAENFLSDFIAGSITPDPDNYDRFFTDEVISQLDAAASEARRGNNLTREEMRIHFEQKR
ncbi:hypothetical protein CCAX7_13320 [Capsulimonas corticalis]|uniref:Uncharacterized protein n=1 Tax=Capsulimonas corticalis TaxID=2219043 RepID=A0A402D4M3_9BACT|nr:hypothetical protein [Capsulimonas corticalis]BDI29281.1 hypothetical protein CCAX7_13320 [Capsulimonas corticalis]